MLPEAYISHQLHEPDSGPSRGRTRGRIRIRVPARKGDAAYFDHVEQALSGQSDIRNIRTNSMTGSILLHHRLDLDALSQLAADKQLFSLQAEKPNAEGVRNVTAKQIERLDHALAHFSHGTYNLAELLFVLLVGASAFQLVRGRVLGPASTLLSYAATLLTIQQIRPAEKLSGTKSGTNIDVDTSTSTNG